MLIEVPTEGIKYLGSKRKIIPHILNLINMETEVNSVFDGFSGTTRVSQGLVKNNHQVHANDIAVWSCVFGFAYLLNKRDPSEYIPLIDHLNSLEPVYGWFSEKYGGKVNERNTPGNNAIQEDGKKRPWQLKNTMKLDAIRDEIDNITYDGVVKAVLLTSLMLALDKVENTLGHYSSYLRNWPKRSYNNLHLKVPEIWINEMDNIITCNDIFDILPDVKCDLAYYDPPYGSNSKMPPSRVRYAGYYHIWKSVVLNDKPQVFGKVNRRIDSSDTYASVFEEFRKDDAGKYISVNAIEGLIQATPCEWIILSYSSGGRATADELNQVINDNGVLKRIVEIDHSRNVMASMKWTNEWIRDNAPNREFLFLIKKC